MWIRYLKGKNHWDLKQVARLCWYRWQGGGELGGIHIQQEDELIAMWHVRWDVVVWRTTVTGVTQSGAGVTPTVCLTPAVTPPPRGCARPHSRGPTCTARAATPPSSPSPSSTPHTSSASCWSPPSYTGRPWWAPSSWPGTSRHTVTSPEKGGGGPRTGQYSTAQYSTVHYNTGQYSAMHCSAAPCYCIVQCRQSLLN